jgi:hypothetical protein
MYRCYACDSPAQDCAGECTTEKKDDHQSKGSYAATTLLLSAPKAPAKTNISSGEDAFVPQLDTLYG